MLATDGDGRLAGICRQYVVTGLFQYVAKTVQQGWFIFDQKYGWHVAVCVCLRLFDGFSDGRGKVCDGGGGYVLLGSLAHDSVANVNYKVNKHEIGSSLCSTQWPGGAIGG